MARTLTSKNSRCRTVGHYARFAPRCSPQGAPNPCVSGCRMYSNALAAVANLLKKPTEPIFLAPQRRAGFFTRKRVYFFLPKQTMLCIFIPGAG